jgi:FKBP-type peptidyl-prolyl cis-trans isomerase
MRFASSFVALSVVVLALAGCKGKEAAPPAKPAAAVVMSETDKTLYALGLLVSRNLSSFQLTSQELEIVKRGMSDGIAGKTPEVELEKYGPKVDELHSTRLAATSAKEAESSKAFLEKAAAEPGATKTASGLVYKQIKAGTGASPKASDQVKVHYTGKLTDGKVFDSSVQRGEPVTFGLQGVIPCWTEGVQLMKVGGKSQLVCPYQIAYGESGRPPVIPPGATLVFDVELLDIVK